MIFERIQSCLMGAREGSLSFCFSKLSCRSNLEPVQEWKLLFDIVALCLLALRKTWLNVQVLRVSMMLAYYLTCNYS